MALDAAESRRGTFEQKVSGLMDRGMDRTQAFETIIESSSHSNPAFNTPEALKWANRFGRGR